MHRGPKKEGILPYNSFKMICLGKICGAMHLKDHASFEAPTKKSQACVVKAGEGFNLSNKQFFL